MAILDNVMFLIFRINARHLFLTLVYVGCTFDYDIIKYFYMHRLVTPLQSYNPYLCLHLGSPSPNRGRLHKSHTKLQPLASFCNPLNGPLKMSESPP